MFKFDKAARRKIHKKSNWHVIKSKGYKPGKFDFRLFTRLSILAKIKESRNFNHPREIGCMY